MLQLIIGIFILAVSTCIAWYEGSAIIENSLEWKTSTPFTQLLNVDITNGQDISQLDYFVYAAKFEPVFPAIMMVSAIYILSVIGYYLINSHTKWAIGFWGVIGCVCMLLSSRFFYSATIGGRIFFWMTLISGVLCIIVTVLVWLKNIKRKITVHTSKM